LNSKPSRGNIESPPTTAKTVVRDVVQAGQPGVNTAKALPNVEALPDFFKLINDEPFILKTARDTFTPAKMATINVKLKDATRYAGPIVSVARERGTREIDE